MATLQIFADYHHFILQDAASAEADGWEVAWPAEALAQMLAVTPRLVAVGTARSKSVPVEVVIAAGPPSPEDEADADLVTQASLAVPSGALVCCGPTAYLPDAARIAVEPGTYGVRVAYRGLATISADGFDGEDRYRVVLWPVATELPAQVVIDRRGAHT